MKNTIPEWNLKGELILNCNCTVFCPCVVSLGKHPPTEGYCQAWMGVRIDEGNFDGESLAGLNIGMVLDILAIPSITRLPIVGTLRLAVS